MIFLDARPEQLIKRIQGRDELEMFETLKSFEKVRGKALNLGNSWNIIDASGSVKETFSLIEKYLDIIDIKK